MSILRVPGACVCTLLLLAVIDADPAAAAIGYAPDPSQPAISLGSQYPHGIAVDQENGGIYVAVVSADASEDADGVVDQLESDGAPTADSPFTGGADAFFGGVAVNPLTGGIYASQAAAPVAGGYIGETKMDLFSAAGVSGGSFSLTTSHQVVPQIAADSAGKVFYPNDATGTVQVFSAAGALEGEISCASCAGGHFLTPVSVAINGAGDLYVVDLGSGRVVELAPSGGTYTYVATLQSGEGAVAVGVDPTLDNVFVGDVAAGGSYHIVAYDAGGTQFDDFGAGLFAKVEYPGVAWQIAVNGATHLLYATDEGRILVFHQAPISPPAVSGAAPSSVGQLTAKLNATLNAEGHAVLSCEFQYAEAAESGFAGAKTAPCSTLPSGTADTAVSARLTSLSPSTSYRYRVVAKNNGGSTTGGEEVFETLPALPAAVSTEAAREVTQSNATLAAEVNPAGGSVSSCEFEYGPTVSYGTSVACERLPEPASTEVPETVKVSGLTANTGYDYRLVVTTNSGTTDGENAEFRTPAQPPPASAESTPSAAPQPPAASAESTPKATPRSSQPSDEKTVKAKKSKRMSACGRGFRETKRRGKPECVKKKEKKRKHPSRKTKPGSALLDPPGAVNA